MSLSALARRDAAETLEPIASPQIQPVGDRRGIAVALDGLTKSFGDREVLRRLDLRIAPGEFVAIVGRSGGGKSTLLRLLAGLETPSNGTIRLDGAALSGLTPDVRMLFQDARLLPWQRVVDNVGIARGKDWRARALESLQDVGLADRAGEWPSVLSGGQRQRVALARALVSRPRLLLLDEPFGALDALTRLDMQKLLSTIWARDGFTTVLITHDVREAVTLADRVLVLRDGAIACDRRVLVPRPRPVDDPQVLRLEKELLAAV
ncbi:MAG: aliphatic sulfonate transporter ATP-binding protein [Rhodospirillales bacterium]|jgi:sulfonate transport system ATP-binding protein|nr:aliphatic sulfonate transporter ATP-binding protein [Rhodospirillales bacterium]